jgi:hypothetical protein
LVLLGELGDVLGQAAVSLHGELVQLDDHRVAGAPGRVLVRSRSASDLRACDNRGPAGMLCGTSTLFAVRGVSSSRHVPDPITHRRVRKLAGHEAAEKLKAERAGCDSVSQTPSWLRSTDVAVPVPV